MIPNTQGVKRIKRLLAVLLAASFLGTGIQNAPAMVRMDQESIDMAINYGIQHQDMGYTTLLGPNWREGAQGVLLNIYTPFMVLAAKAYNSGLPTNPTESDLVKARKAFRQEIKYLKDDHEIKKVKFSVALFGNTPDFASRYTARIEGYGRGKKFNLRPDRSLFQKIADKSEEGSSVPYDAINAYYFDFNTLEMMDKFDLYIQGPEGTEPVRFQIDTKQIY